MVHSDNYYIMVEDELHDIAHQFTRSLHRAEYQRLQALAATKNASSISEIQRPTYETGAIPKGHLTKLDCIIRGKKQGSLLKNISRVKDDDGLNSDEEEKERMSQWEGTNLGALMLSPGQRKRDLSTKWKMKATTRAAAGFHRGKSELASQRQAVRCVKDSSDIDEANVPRRLFGGGRARESLAASVAPGPLQSVYQGKEVKMEHSDTGDEDDDLDAPIPKPVPKAAVSRHTYHNPAPFALQSKSSASTKPLSPNLVTTKHVPSVTVDLSVFDDFLPLPASKSSIPGTARYKGRAMAALAKKREMEKTK